ncbi:site-specific integrase [Actinoplanes sp. NPDC049316]|uniref:tyrosine-type recombinase/integrase n=1 Tax=Actinoplanes sp. NPDC049316 TaxID=3154727 RepID=UPI0034268439
MEADTTAGKWYAPAAGRTTVGEWAEQWYTAGLSGWKPKTRHTYRSILDRLVVPALGHVQLIQLRPIQVREWVGDMAGRVGAEQVRQGYRLLSQVMASAVDNDMIPVSPCRGVRLPRTPQGEPHILTIDEVTRLADACEPGDRVLVLLLAYGGLRIGEALPLRRRHLDVDGGRVVVEFAVTELPGGPVIDTPKDHQRRELLVPAFVVEAVRRYLATVPDGPEVFVFPGRQKHTAARQQSYSGFRRRFRRAVAEVGLNDVTPHDLRATHASWVADSRGVMTAARRLGHANASVTTRHYARPIDERDAQVARHLDDLGAGRRSGTRRARKHRKGKS